MKRIVINTTTVTAALRNSDPVMANFTCVRILSVDFDRDDTKQVVVGADVHTGEKEERCVVFITVGADGTLYGDI